MKDHQVKVGEILNPDGTRGEPISSSLRKLSLQEVERVVALILTNNLESLKKIPSDPSMSVLTIWAASIAVRAINEGGYSALDSLLNRVLGKPKERIDISFRDETVPMSDEELEREISRLREITKPNG